MYKRFNRLIISFFCLLLIGCQGNQETVDLCLSAIKHLPQKAVSEQPKILATKPIASMILDVTGSMNAPVSDQSSQTKIQDARNVIKQIVKDPRAESLELGFTAFGHLQDGCDHNIQVLQDPLLAQKTSVVSLLDELEPRGSTPLAVAIRETGNQLLNIQEEEDQKITIVLVSDGEETCQGDPLAEVEALQQKGLNFVFHVIGYGTSNDVNEKLRKLAEAGEGQLFNPQNVIELQSHLSQSVFGFGKFQVLETESSYVQGWKIYEGDELRMHINRTSKSSDLLWQEQTMQAGQYNFCLYFQKGNKENVLVKDIYINTNHSLVIDPSTLVVVYDSKNL